VQRTGLEVFNLGDLGNHVSYGNLLQSLFISGLWFFSDQWRKVLAFALLRASVVKVLSFPSASICVHRQRTDLKFSISAILAILAVLAIFSHLPYRLLLPITRFPDLPILLRAKFFLIALYFHARFCLYCFEAGFILNRK
jgi:hypothetical protein